jgi:hypothetical protein
MRDLVACPASAVPYLAKRLQPVAGAEKVPRWIADLDSPVFETREKAATGLAALGDVAEPSLRQALAQHPTLEARRRIERILDKLDPSFSPIQLQALRASDVLEQIGNAPAREVLRQLAEGAPGSCITQAAKAAVRRLTGKKAGAEK